MLLSSSLLLLLCMVIVIIVVVVVAAVLNGDHMKDRSCDANTTPSDRLSVHSINSPNPTGH